ncbi:hypothetical protein V5O48_012400 [Marasmius crinis-equi]|uniref:Uncharacterized protein n=1 Tax=Marasmius crinis-equi TaxID=585013 RepID=A0ABR3F2W0_9AGAR
MRKYESIRKTAAREKRLSQDIVSFTAASVVVVEQLAVAGSGVDGWQVADVEFLDVREEDDAEEKRFKAFVDNLPRGFSVATNDKANKCNRRHAVLFA